ncbi:MAG: hypothetical protein IKT33_04240, partial [Clostridia bacterium]|nr:hypothetical protein [Clostridia bacterium]
MGKLGNNLKSTVFVLIAILAAVAAFPFAANLFGIKQLTNYEISNLKAVDPGNDFNPDNFVTKKPTLYTSVVYNGYITNPIKSGPTYQSGFSASVRYKLVCGSNEKITSTGSVNGPECDKYFIPGSTTTVYYQLIYSGTVYDSSTGTYKPYTRNSVWSKVDSVSVTRGNSITVTVDGGRLPSTNYAYSASNNNKYPFSNVSTYHCYVNDTEAAHLGEEVGKSIRYFASKSSTAAGDPSELYDGPNKVEAVCGGTNYLWAKVLSNSYSDAYNTYQYLGVSRTVVNFPNAFVSSSYSVLSGRSATVPYTGSKYKYPFEVNATFKFNTANVIYVAVNAGSIGYDIGGYTSAELKNLEFSAVGTYNTFARVKGNQYTNDSGYVMVDGASFTITKSDLAPGYITGRPTATNGTYGTGAALFSGSVTVSDKLVGGGSVSYGYSTAAGATKPSTTVTNLSDITTDLGVGTYTLWYKITGDSNWNDTTWLQDASATVSQGEGTLDDGNLSFYTSNKQYYTGSSITMFTAGKAAGGVGGTVYYAVTTTGNKPNDTNTGGSTSLPTVTYPGTYTLYYRRESNTNYTAVGWTKSGLGEKIIYKAATDISATGLSVVSSTVAWKSGGVQLFKGNGTITKGSGTIKYALSLGKSASDAPTVTGESDITKVKAANIGTYYLWYKLEGKKVNDIQCWDDHVWEYTYLAAVQVTAAASKLKPNTLAQYTTTAKYTGSPLQLFKNEAAFEYGAGTILYGLSTKSDVMTIPNTTYNTAAAAKPTNAGPWYLWYKSTGSGNYAGTEWAYSGISNEIAKGEQTGFTYGCAVAQAEYTFNNEYRYPFSGKITVTTGNTATDAITYGWATTSNGEPTSDNTAKATTSLKIKNAGTYYLLFRVAENDNYKDTGWKSANKSVKINPQTDPKLDGSNISVKTGLKWNGSSQLVCPNSTLEAVCTNGDLSKFVYCLNTSSAWSDATKIGEWGTVLSLAAEKPGTYYIFAKSSIDETTENTSHIDSPVYLSKSVIIDKKDKCELEKDSLDVATTGAVYFNAQKSQTLFKGAGYTDSNGKIQYALGSNSAATGSWTTDITAVQLAKGQAIGTYYLWYKVDATEYCTAVPEQRVKLSDGTYLSKEISQLAAPTFTANSSLKAQSLTYNGSSQKLFEATSVTNAAANSTGDGDQIYYYVTGTSATPTVAVTNANVKTDVSDLVSTNVGTGEFYLWYQQNGTTNCAATTKWVYSGLCTTMARASVHITGDGTGTLAANPNLMPFTNSAQILFTSSKVALDSNNVAVTDGH